MKKTITVTGKGKLSLNPDTIRINMKIEDCYKEYDETVRKSIEATGDLRSIIEEAGLDPQSLKTNHFSIDSRFESYQDENDNYQRRFVGYEYIHKLFIEFPNDNRQLGKILYELASSELNVEFSIVHTVKDTEAAKQDLLIKAVSDSKAIATVLAQATGVSLGEIKTIDYSWGELEIYSEVINNMEVRNAMSFSNETYDIDIEAANIDIEDTVTIEWEII